ncbi:hypothetical protein J7T55_010545 [Diaporthe amygdali]|uniref:uncharacterized protein n=1 Tax=Phomopsis amygdali TaxID=1214568 RepID=UPI0022FE8369|nr:uncharacterized protein J7T55_010545 [Diaporthe amygdali]KAJ0115722.1 hypothetical protein J7T55_010545 [Diaporthe amygdali]
MANFVDHYAVLGVTFTADTTAIKKAYRQLALRHHPDKAAPGKESDAADFIRALAAYEILIDDAKRETYDNQYRKRSKATARGHSFVPPKTTRGSYFSHQETETERDGNYGTGSWAEDLGGDEDDIEEDYPSDASTDPMECDDTGAYEDGYADPHYESGEDSNQVCVDEGLDDGAIFTEDFDSTEDKHYFPTASADDHPSMQGCGGERWKWDPDNEHDRDNNPAPRISHPETDAFDLFAGMSKSHYLEEKVKGRYFKGTLLELRAHKNEWDNIDAQLRDIAARLRCRVGDMPAGSIPFGEFEASLSAKMKAAHRSVDYVRGVTEFSLEVMRQQHDPKFWRLLDKRTWSIIGLLERNAGRMEEMKSLLWDLDEIVSRLETFTNSELRDVKGYLRTFMSEMGDWRRYITSKLK